MSINLTKIINGDEIKYFTQFNVYKTLHFPNKRIDLQIPIEGDTKLNIVSTKFIDTLQGTSIEGQYLTGKKLVVLGVLNVNLLIFYWNCKLKVSLKNMKLPFSNFIIVPKEICANQPINLRYLIEDITTKAITSHEILVSATILLQFVDEYIL